MIRLIIKIITVILLFLTTSCEKDDICIDPTTPKLVIVFYDKDNHSLKKEVPDLLVEIDSLNTFIPYGTAISTDSISLPLRVDADFTKYRFIKKFDDNTNQVIDVFTLNYEREIEFVSRSCGYKAIFNNISISDLTTNWINEIEIKQQNILNEKEAHLSVYH
jgi:hypothetical protein